MTRSSTSKRIGPVAVLSVAGLSLLILTEACTRKPPLDPRQHLGSSWDPERARRLAARGRALLGTRDHESATIRLEDDARLELLKQGEPAKAGGRILDVAQGSFSFQSETTDLCDQPPCLVWQFQGVDMFEDASFGGVSIQVESRMDKEHKFNVSFPTRDGVPVAATVPLVARQVMKYVVLPSMSKVPDNSAGLSDQALTLVFPGLEAEDEIQVLSVRTLAKTAGYAELPAGNAYESLDDEMRPVFYQWVDGEAAWNIAVPELQPALKFGIGLLPDSAPVTFSVRVEWDDETLEIFKETVDEANAWLDRSIELGAWRGREARVIFRSESSASTLALWSSPRVIQTGRKGRLFCVYLIDALRPDFVEGFSTFRGRKNSTPAIHALAQEGVQFTNALANAPLTKYSMSALFSGLSPDHTGVMAYQRVPDEVSTLAEVFRESGFLTASFSLNGNSGRLRGLHQGFDHSFSIRRIGREAALLRGWEETHVGRLGLASSVLIDDLLFDFLGAHEQEDIFLFLHAMDPHTPYVPDDEHLEGFNAFMADSGLEAPADRRLLLEELSGWHRLPDEDRLPEEALLELYRGTVETADKHLLRFMDFLESSGMKSRSTIVLTADHGEHLGEHANAQAFTHMHPMFLEVLGVPLVIATPWRAAAARQVTVPVQLADVMPTLLDLAGIPYDAGRFDGASLLLLMAGEHDDLFDTRPIVSQSHPYWSVLLGNIHSPDVTRTRNAQVFDVTHDPREQAPLRGASARKHVEELVGALALLPRRPIPGADTIVNEEDVLKQLKALGYID